MDHALRERYVPEELIGISRQHTCYRGRGTVSGRPAFMKRAIDECCDLDHHSPACCGLGIEAAVLRRLARHGGDVPAPLAIGHHDGQALLVLKYLPGQSLEVFRQRGGLDLLQAVHILDQVASTVELAHDLGYVHHDIKPGNIVALPDGRAVLVDWGSATFLRPLSERLSHFTFTPGYGSADQQEGAALVTDDIFALARTLAAICWQHTQQMRAFIAESTARPPRRYLGIAAWRRGLRRLVAG